MDKETVERLLALNRQFYTAFAEPFANSRSASDPALTSILPHIPQSARVLDVGCGNARLALLLDRERPGSIYVGVDVVAELIERARLWDDQPSRVQVSLHVADVTRPGWADVLSPVPFDCVVALALLHHVPDFGLRARVLREIADLLKPTGRLIISAWQFLASERMRRKIVPWAEVGITEEKLDRGDFLLDWKRGGQGLRYCHLLDDEEVERLAEASGLHLVETFRAGGREGNLSLVAILNKARST